MATATRVKPADAELDVLLALTPREARVVMAMCALVNGNTKGTARAQAADVFDALNNIGIDCYPASNLFSGALTARG